MFYGCSSLISADLSYLNTSNVINTRQMFEECSSLVVIDLLYFNLDKVTDSTNMFWHINFNIKYLNLYHTRDKNNIIQKSSINGAYYLTVCQQEKLIDNTRSTYTCCDFNIEKGICEINYVIFNLNSGILYVGSNNALTSKIKFIKSNNQIIVDLQNVYLSKGIAEFHFKSPLSDLSYLFSQNENEIMKNVESIDLTYLDTSSINDTKHMFELKIYRFYKF
jgi:surface protein